MLCGSAKVGTWRTASTGVSAALGRFSQLCLRAATCADAWRDSVLRLDGSCNRARSYIGASVGEHRCSHFSRRGELGHLTLTETGYMSFVMDQMLESSC